MSASSASRRSSSCRSSSCASSRMSGSFRSSSVAVICATTSLYSRNRSTSGCISATAFEWVRNFAESRLDGRLRHLDHHLVVLALDC